MWIRVLCERVAAIRRLFINLRNCSLKIQKDSVSSKLTEQGSIPMSNANRSYIKILNLN